MKLEPLLSHKVFRWASGVNAAVSLIMLALGITVATGNHGLREIHGHTGLLAGHVDLGGGRQRIAREREQLVQVCGRGGDMVGGVHGLSPENLGRKLLRRPCAPVPARMGRMRGQAALLPPV